MLTPQMKPFDKRSLQRWLLVYVCCTCIGSCQHIYTCMYRPLMASGACIFLHCACTPQRCACRHTDSHHPCMQAALYVGLQGVLPLIFRLKSHTFLSLMTLPLRHSLNRRLAALSACCSACVCTLAAASACCNARLADTNADAPLSPKQPTGQYAYAESAMA